jgi:hypothetical protein
MLSVEQPGRIYMNERLPAASLVEKQELSLILLVWDAGRLFSEDTGTHKL